MIGGGRAAVRRALYMPTIVAIHHNPVIRVVYRRLTAAGRPKKVAIIAAMRKFLTLLNACSGPAAHGNPLDTQDSRFRTSPPNTRSAGEARARSGQV